MEKKPLIFNLTHLIGKRNNLTPTGIDRVDIRYAKFCLEQTSQRLVLFVHQHRRVLRLVEDDYARALIKGLFNRWVEVKKTDNVSGMNDLQFVLRWIGTYIKERQHDLINKRIKHKLNGKRPPIYINGSPLGCQYECLHRQLKEQLGATLIFCLYDLIPIDFPEYASTTHAKTLHKSRVKSMAQTGSIIWAISEATKDRFLAFCSVEKVTPPQIEVIHIGVEEDIIEASQLSKQSIPIKYASKIKRPYFVIVSTIEPRKNHLLLLTIWQQLVVELGDQCPSLVIIGRRGWQIDHVINILEKSAMLQDNVIELNDVTDSEMIALIQNAQASLFPSFDEGWGMPVAEALTLHTPVICSDIPVLRECSQNLAEFIDPLDGVGWKSTIVHYCLKAKSVKQDYKPSKWKKIEEDILIQFNCHK